MVISVLFLGIPQMVLLTKVDEACPDAGKDLQNIYLSAYIKTKVRIDCFSCYWSVVLYCLSV